MSDKFCLNGRYKLRPSEAVTISEALNELEIGHNIDNYNICFDMPKSEVVVMLTEVDYMLAREVVLDRIDKVSGARFISAVKSALGIIKDNE